MMRGGSRGHLLSALEASLRRLQTDYVDLWQLHAFDLLTPWEETMAALDAAVSSGKVRYVGVSNFGGWRTVFFVAAAMNAAPPSCRALIRRMRDC